MTGAELHTVVTQALEPAPQQGRRFQADRKHTLRTADEGLDTERSRPGADRLIVKGT